jgi:hypothetical protein
VEEISRSPSRGVVGRKGLPPFFYVNVVWGADYVDPFTQFSIPSLLAPNNIAGAPNRQVSEFVIVATDEDTERIRSSAIFPRLCKLIQVTFLPFTVTTEHKYSEMNRGHALAVDYVARRGYCVFLSPDAIVSDGMVKRLFVLAAQGRRVVAGFGPRVEQDAFLQEIRGAPEYRQGEPLALNPVRLVALMMAHLHPDTLKHFVDCAHFPEKPYACIWPAPAEDGMLVRALNLHPYLFDTRLIPERQDWDWTTMTIDWNLMPLFVTDWNDVYVEKDSDNFCIASLTPAGVRAKPNVPNRLETETLSLWLLRNRYALINRSSFLYSILFHARPLNDEWTALVKRTDSFAREVADPGGALRDYTILGHALVTKPKPSGTEAAMDNKLRSSDPDGKSSLSHGTPSRSTGSEPAPPTKGGPIPFFYGFPVWGERYIENFCRFTIPSLLSPNNLPGLPNNDVSRFVIVTTLEDAKRLREHSIFRLLTRFIEVEFLSLPSGDSPLPTSTEHDRKYLLLSAGHSIIGDRATGRGYALPLAPDAIYSDGMFRRLHEFAVAGKEVVVGFGPRVNEETITPELIELGLLQNGEPLCISPRHAVDLFMRHMHEDARLQRWASPLYARSPYMCVWDVGGGDGVLIRCFALHPYLIDYRHIAGDRVRPQDASAVDASFIMNCLFTWDGIHQVTDSDDFIVLSITPMNHRDYPREFNSDPFGTLARWATRHDVTMLHRFYFMNGIKMHRGDLDDRWHQLERDTLKIAYDILGGPAGSAGRTVEREMFEAVARERAQLEDTVARERAQLEDTVARERAQLEDTIARERAAINDLAIGRMNEMLAGDLAGVSGRLALQVVLRKVARKLRLG